MKKIFLFLAAAAIVPLFAANIVRRGGSISATNGKLSPYLWEKKGQVFSMTGKGDDGKAFSIVIESLIWYHGRSGNTEHIYQDQSEANWKVQKSEVEGNLIKSYSGNVDFDILREVEFFDDSDAVRFEYIVTARDDREIARLNFPIMRLSKEVEKISFDDGKLENFTSGVSVTSLKDTGKSMAFFLHMPARNKTVLLLVDLNAPLKYGHQMGVMPNYSHGSAKAWCRTMSFQHIYRWAYDFHKAGEKTGMRFFFQLLDGAELTDAHKEAARLLAKKMKVEPAKFSAAALDNVYRYPSKLAALLPSVPGVKVWSEITTKRVYPAMELPTKSAAAINLSAAANERESTQIVFNPEKAAKLEKVSFTDLVSDSGAKIAGNNFYANILGVQKVAAPRAVFYGETRYPDKLIPLEDALPAKLKAGQNTIMHVTFFIPSGTPKGVYKGAVALRINGEECKIPVTVKVWGFELPKVSKYTAYGLLWSSPQEHRDQVMKRMSEYGWCTTVYSGGQKELRQYFDGKELRLPDNFELAERAIKKYNYSMFAVPYVFLGAWDWNPKKPVNFLRLMIDSPEFDEKFVNYLKSSYRQLKEKGLVERSFLYIWDEMTGGHYDALAKTMNMVRKYAPGVKALTVAAPDPQVLKYNDIIVTGGVGSWWGAETAKVAEKALADGKELWIYLNGITFATDVPPNVPRLTVWQCFTYGFTGFLQWSMDFNWKYGSFEKNGLTWILYPGYEKPVYAARLEYFRDGMEDFNMFMLAKKLLPASKKAEFEALINKVAPKNAEMSQDPVLMYQVRDQIGELLSENLAK